MIKSKKIVFIIVTLIITLIFGYRYCTSNYTNEGIINNIIGRDGYSLSLESEQIPLEIFIKPEWIAFNQDERKELKVKVLELYNTDIWLDNVWNRGNDIYFSFTTSFNMNYKAGEFIYNGFFNTNGTFTTPSGEVKLYDKNLNEFSVGQTGTGPGASFSFGVQPEDQKKLEKDFT